MVVKIEFTLKRVFKNMFQNDPPRQPYTSVIFARLLILGLLNSSLNSQFKTNGDFREFKFRIQSYNSISGAADDYSAAGHILTKLIKCSYYPLRSLASRPYGIQSSRPPRRRPSSMIQATPPPSPTQSARLYYLIQEIHLF